MRTKLLEGIIRVHFDNGPTRPDTIIYPGENWAYMVCFSDGVSSVLSDDEVVDLARDAPDPKTAADQILAFAEEMGSEDNATAIVVPLAGWGRIRGPDKTKSLREYRRHQAGQHQDLDRSFYNLTGSPLHL